MDARYAKKYPTSYMSESTARKLSEYNESDYNSDSTAPLRHSRPTPIQKPVNSPKRRPSVSHDIDFLSMLILLIAMGATFYCCLHYLKVQSDSSKLDKQLIALENQYKVLKDKNNATLLEINQAVDLNKIYAKAVSELGMVHANKNETYHYVNEDNGYVRQYEDIPNLPNDSFTNPVNP